MAAHALTRRGALAFAQRLTSNVETALGGRLGGAVLHGSLVLGGYLPGRSDIDLLAIVEHPLGDDERQAIVDAASCCAAAACADIRVVTRQVASRPTPLPAMEAHLRIRPGRRPSVAVEAIDARERDLVIELSVCRAHGRSLLGPSPADLIGRVADDWVLEVGLAQLRDWQAIGHDPRYAELTVLTACRLWRFAEEALHCSKDAAGEWALRRRPDLGVIRDALDQRRSEPVRSINGDQVAALLGLVDERVVAALSPGDLAVRLSGRP